MRSARCTAIQRLLSAGGVVPLRGAPVDRSPELPWEEEESCQRCLCRIKESAVDDCHGGSPLRGARSIHFDSVHAVSRLPEPSLRAQTVDPSTGDEGRLETKSPRGTRAIQPGPSKPPMRGSISIKRGLTRWLIGNCQVPREPSPRKVQTGVSGRTTFACRTPKATASSGRTHYYITESTENPSHGAAVNGPHI